jgi:hypothetical protein
MKAKFIIAFFIFSATQIRPFFQSDSLFIFNEEILRFLEDESEDINDDGYAEQIEYLISNPVDLNSADISEFILIPFLSHETADYIFREREKRGGFKSIYDLLTLKNFNNEQFLLIKPFIIINDNHPSSQVIDENNISISLRYRMMTDIQKRAGFEKYKYAGDRIKYYSRLKAESGNFAAGFINEKDPGENNFFDHYAGYFQYNSINKDRRIIFGDYNLEFGQGLVLWQPYAFAKGVQSVISPLKNNRIFRPFLSSEENLYFRGAAAALCFQRLSMAAFYSSNLIDANLNESGILSLSRSGYHRTAGEIRNKNSIRSELIGGQVTLSPIENFKLGFLYLYNDLGYDFLPGNAFNATGKIHRHASVSFNAVWKTNNLSGEIAYQSGRIAYILNLFLGMNDFVDILISYRDYSPDYYSFYANGFSEYGNTQNESGFYAGAEFKTAAGNINLYHDQFSTYTKSFHSIFPLYGYEIVTYYEKKIFRNTKLRLKYKIEEKDIEVKQEILPYITKSCKKNYSIELNLKPFKDLRCKTKFEFVEITSSGDKSSGFNSFQDFRLQVTKAISIHGRFSVFQTDSYNSRLYQFENDLPGLMRNTAVYGEGTRWYFLANIRPIKNLILSFKYSETVKPNERFLGTGDSQISGNIDNRIGFQAEFNF